MRRDANTRRECACVCVDVIRQVHHGNGIERVHWEDPAVLYVSLHRYNPAQGKDWFYPGTGGVDDVGAGAGEGLNLNVPWPDKGLGDADYLAAFDLVVARIFSFPYIHPAHTALPLGSGSYTHTRAASRGRIRPPQERVLRTACAPAPTCRCPCCASLART